MQQTTKYVENYLKYDVKNNVRHFTFNMFIV
jgi:hypothetical protein